MEIILDRIIHDIKQPLNIIRVIAQDINIDIRKERLKTEELKRSIDEIILEVDNEVKLLDKIKIFVREEKREEKKEKKNLTKICEDVVKHIKDKFPRIKIETKIEKDDLKREVKFKLLESALKEILINAAQAAEEIENAISKVEMKIKMEEKEINIEVRNNGAGISKEKKEKIFEPFFTTKKKAAGLGLTLALEMVKKEGGMIKIKEEENDFSCCCEIILPIEEEEKK